MNTEMNLVRPNTLRRQVENALREAIMSGRFHPGQRLIERELCENLGVSRTSIREALRQLEAEKLICIVPHKGPTVASISLKEAEELYALRSVLEGFCRQRVCAAGQRRQHRAIRSGRGSAARSR
jgi:DNA-binding GntR family transcriptional regulator